MEYIRKEELSEMGDEEFRLKWEMYNNMYKWSRTSFESGIIPPSEHLKMARAIDILNEECKHRGISFYFPNRFQRFLIKVRKLFINARKIFKLG